MVDLQQEIDYILRNGDDAARMWEIVDICNNAFFNGEGVIDDARFDNLVHLLRVIDPHNPRHDEIGYSIEDGEKAKLPRNMGGLDQVHAGEFETWVARSGYIDENVVISAKLDGVSVLLTYRDGTFVDAFTRGDGSYGRRITTRARYMNIVNAVNVSNIMVRAEMVMSEKIFAEKYADEFTNARALVSGVINASKIEQYIDKLADIDVIAYELITPEHDLTKMEQFDLLRQMGFKHADYALYSAKSLSDNKLTDILTEMKEQNVHALDGIVIDINASDKRVVDDSRNSHNPRYAVKYKVTDLSNIAEVSVIGVEWNPSKHAFLKPTVIIEPTQLCGVTINRLTGFNAGFIKNNGIGKGARIRITRSGDVIPFIMGTIDRAEPDMPLEQDFGEVEWDGVELRMVHETDAVIKAQMIDFFSRLEVARLKDGNITKLYDAGYVTIEDVILMEKSELVKVLGVIGKEAHDSIVSVLASAPIYHLMGAYPSFGVGVGGRVMRAVLEAFPNLMHDTPSIMELSSVHTIGEARAQRILSGLEQFRKFYDKISKRIGFREGVAARGDGLGGRVYCFTGVRDKKLCEFLENNGAIANNNFTKATNILVVADIIEANEKPTNKVKRAKLMREKDPESITIIGYDELLAEMSELGFGDADKKVNNIGGAFEF